MSSIHRQSHIDKDEDLDDHHHHQNNVNINLISKSGGTRRDDDDVNHLGNNSNNYNNTSNNKSNNHENSINTKQQQLKQNQANASSENNDNDNNNSNSKQAPISTINTTTTTTNSTGPLKRLIVDCLFILLRLLIGLYDVLSQPYFYFKYRVYELQQSIDEQAHSEQLDPSDPSSPWRQVNIDSYHAELERDVDKFKNFDEMLQTSLKRFSKDPCYGYRQVLHEQWIKRGESDKLVRQVRLSDYKWCTYGQLDQQVEAMKRGLLLSGIRAGDKVMIYADTRPEWQISSQALMAII